MATSSKKVLPFKDDTESDRVEVKNPKLWLVNKLAQSQTEVFTDKVRVTPALARAILANNPGNRNLSKQNLAKLEQDMKEGNFQFNGENIIIAKTGELNDGQHRLQAIANTGISQTMNLTFGVARGSRFTVDNGKGRTAADQIGLSGFTSSNNIATVGRLILQYEKTGKTGLGKDATSTSTLLERARNDRDLLDAAKWSQNASRKLSGIVPANLAGFCYYEFHKIDKAKAAEFMRQFKEGTELPAKSPVHVAREKLRMTRGLTTLERVEIIFRAFNLFMKGVQTTRIMVTKELPKLGA